MKYIGMLWIFLIGCCLIIGCITMINESGKVNAKTSEKISVPVTAPTAKITILTSSTNANFVKYVYNQPALDSFSAYVEWADFDKGNKMDFTTVDKLIASLAVYGKKVNLIVWANPDNVTQTCINGGTNNIGNCATPSYIWTKLTSANYTTCTNQYGTQRIANYLNPFYISSYQAAMKALVTHVANNPAVGYIRFGLGHGGESIPTGGWNDTSTACGKAFSTPAPKGWGYSIPAWEAYLKGMLTYEGTLGKSKQLMVGITPMGSPGDQVPDFVAPIAAQNNIGFGSQGLQKSDVNNCAKSTADWCNLFVKYPNVPHELQQALASCPDNSCTTGSLTVWLPWAVANHTTIVELYAEAWSIAFIPTDPNHAKYGAAYAAAINKAAGH